MFSHIGFKFSWNQKWMFHATVKMERRVHAQVKHCAVYLLKFWYQIKRNDDNAADAMFWQTFY